MKKTMLWGFLALLGGLNNHHVYGTIEKIKVNVETNKDELLKHVFLQSLDFFVEPQNPGDFDRIKEGESIFFTKENPDTKKSTLYAIMSEDTIMSDERIDLSKFKGFLEGKGSVNILCLANDPRIPPEQKSHDILKKIEEDFLKAVKGKYGDFLFQNNGCLSITARIFCETNEDLKQFHADNIVDFPNKYSKGRYGNVIFQGFQGYIPRYDGGVPCTEEPLPFIESHTITLKQKDADAWNLKNKKVLEDLNFDIISNIDAPEVYKARKIPTLAPDENFIFCRRRDVLDASVFERLENDRFIF